MQLRILHLGLGSFHRAHQAVYMQRLADQGDSSWTLASGNIRPDGNALVDALARQGGKYTLETVDSSGERHYQLVSSISRIIPSDESLAGFIALGADPATRVISFTVTEAGYYLRPDDSLDVSAPDIVGDLAACSANRAGTTLYGALVAILRARMLAQAGPVTLLCCDNLRHNGKRSRTGLLRFIEALGDAQLASWVGTHTSSPNCMVDRITPRPTPDIAARVLDATGMHDDAALMAESFLQWVVEDDFIAGRPAWQQAGVEMVSDVAPHEEAKIRVLNATHSCIAWAGTLAGHEFIHEGTLDARVRAIAFDYATDDAIPVLLPSPVDLPAYRDTVLARFSNPVIRDTNQRVFADSYAKIATFIAPTISDRLARNEPIESVAMLPALYLACLHRWNAGGLPFAYDDKALDPGLAKSVCDAPDPVRALAAQVTLWGSLAGDERLAGTLARAALRVSAFERGA